MRPENGDILICDNDNVEENGKNHGLALGTAGFMAQKFCSKGKTISESDLFSMAVLMFHLLTR